MTAKIPTWAIRIAISPAGETFFWRLLLRNTKIVGGVGVKSGEADTREQALLDAVDAAEAFAVANKGQLFATKWGYPVYLRFDRDLYVAYESRPAPPRRRTSNISVTGVVHGVASRIEALRAEMVRSHPDRGGTCEAFIAARAAYEQAILAFTR
jgi:hypothetical protein